MRVDRMVTDGHEDQFESQQSESGFTRLYMLQVELRIAEVLRNEMILIERADR